MIRLGMMVAFGLLAFQGAGFVQCEKLHEILTDEEFTKVFRTTRDNVPEYQVVPITHDLYKRSTVNLNMQFSAFDRKFNIRLNPSDGILAGENTPVWLASAGSNGAVNYKKLKSNIVGSVAKSFVDPKSFASFVVHESSINKSAFHGTFDDLTIVPLPASVREVTEKEFKRFKGEVPGPSRTLVQTDYHVIIKTKASPRDSVEPRKQVNKVAHHFDETDYDRRKRFANDIVYPSLLVVTDYSGIAGPQDESKIKDEIRYQLAFWNSVDLRFRDLESPKVRLRIAGIVIGLDQRATPYIYYFLNGKNVDDTKAVMNMPDYWNYQTSNPDFKPGAYNVIITLTNYNLYDAKNPEEETTGISYIGGFCEGLSPANFKAVGLVHDDMKFAGINTAAHELGHILGARHDTDATGPCADSIGYIMSAVRSETSKMNHWSTCSLEKIKYYLGQANHCADQPAELHSPGNPIERIAPGDILTAQQQCEARGYLYACPPKPQMCEKLQCYSIITGIVPKPHCRNASVGALDGTVCALESICVRGVCQKEDQIVQ